MARKANFLENINVDFRTSNALANDALSLFTKAKDNLKSAIELQESYLLDIQEEKEKLDNLNNDIIEAKTQNIKILSKIEDFLN